MYLILSSSFLKAALSVSKISVEKLSSGNVTAVMKLISVKKKVADIVAYRNGLQLGELSMAII